MSPLCAATELPPYEAGRFAPEDRRLFRPGGMELTARAISLAGLPPGASVLDLGCGSGQSLRYLSSLGFHAVGIDSQPFSPEQGCKSTSQPTRIVASAEALPFADGSMGAVLAECSLSVMEHPAAVVAECARVLAIGGRLMITDVYARRPEAIGQIRALKNSCIAGMIVRTELEAILSRHSFACDLWEDHSQALREFAARFILDHGSLAGLWGCGAEPSEQITQSAMKAVRAGYFLLIATRTPENKRKASGEK